jgi:maltokinase
MSEPTEALGQVSHLLDDQRLAEWLPAQRWFASKSQALTGIELIEEATIDDDIALAMCQVLFASGGHELYQLAVSGLGGDLELDALGNPAHARTLLRAIDEGREVSTPRGRFCFRYVADAERSLGAQGDEPEPVRLMGAEQSNSSVVFGDRLVLKMFRRLEPGINPELEMLRFLTARNFSNIAPLHGWYEYEGEALAGTLGIVQHFVVGGIDGWELALDEIPHNTETMLGRLASLGTATARLHSMLATDFNDPAFSPEEPSAQAVSLLTATMDEEIERVFAKLPDDPRLAPIAGLEQEVRDRIISRRPNGPSGRIIRIHGDYHLGQTLHTGDGWTLLDFEGEPARPLATRRAKRSPLRDVASMLRSFSYAAWAVELQRGQTTPPDFEQRAREAFLEAYLADVEPSLLPPGEPQINNLLSIFELEKALYELRYELNNRPDWVAIPVAGIARIVESG